VPISVTLQMHIVGAESLSQRNWFRLFLHISPYRGLSSVVCHIRAPA